jgi:hypothetical protein
VAEREGQYTLPPVELAWWDVGADELRSARADEVVIEVVANPGLATEIALPPDDPETVQATGDSGARISVVDALRRWGPWALLLAGVLYAIFRALQRFGTRIENSILGDAAAREEKRRFRAFRAAAHAQDAPATARCFMQWLDFRSQSPCTYASFAAEAHDADLDVEARALGSSLYGQPGAACEWSGQVLVNGVDRARHRRRKHAEQKEPVLPPLNP